MILSRACEYGIQAILVLNQAPAGEFMTVREIARRAKVPVSFLAKIVGKLVAGGLLESLKGPRGGVRLARPTSRITFQEVVEAIDGLSSFRRCVLGFPRCSSDSPCPLHEQWAPLREGISQMLSEKSLEVLVREVQATRRSGGTRKAKVKDVR